VDSQKVLAKIENRNFETTQQPRQRVKSGLWHLISSIELSPKWHIQYPWTIEQGRPRQRQYAHVIGKTQQATNQGRLRPKRVRAQLEEWSQNRQLRVIWIWPKQERLAARQAKFRERQQASPSWRRASIGSAIRQEID